MMSPSPDAKTFCSTSSDAPTLLTVSFQEDPKASLGAQVGGSAAALSAARLLVAATRFCRVSYTVFKNKSKSFGSMLYAYWAPLLL